MLNLVRGWLSSRRESGRDIFQYWDGKRKRGIDPLHAYRSLLAHPTFDWEVHPGLIDEIDSDDAHTRNMAIEASEVTVQAVRDVFGVNPWTDNSPGLTESEMIGLLIGFVDYLVGVKKNSSHTRTTPEPTVPMDSATSSAGPSHTSATSASGSTPQEPPSETPGESSSP